ncbi:MAG: hypothetical protein KJO07_11105 [Deltaproteobacteria bacterium]|nr:hypothetical protein [Deltaproteobacteria bacterium]
MQAACRCGFLAIFVVLGAGAADADRWQAGATLTIDTEAGSVIDRGEGDELDHQGSFGVTLRGLASKQWPVFLGAGLDYRIGGSAPGGFLYEFNLMPLGLGYVVGDDLMVGMFAGAGVSQITGRVEVAAQFPVEARVDLRLSRRLFLTGAARALWALRDSRNAGSRTLDPFDEASARLTFRFGRRYHERKSSSTGDGYLLGVVVSEARGSRTWLGVFGYSLDVMAQRIPF